MRQRIIQVLSSMLIVASAVVASDGSHVTAAEPAIEVTAVADEARGGLDITIDLLELNLPEDDNDVWVYLSRDGSDDLFDPLYGGTGASCPPVSDPDNDRVTNRCSVFAYNVIDVGEYDLNLEVAPSPSNPNWQFFSATFTITESIEPWWDDVELTIVTRSIFTGSTSIEMRFDSVPASVAELEIAALYDDQFFGSPNTVQKRFGCTSEAGGAFVCATSLPALCVEDDIAGQYCSGSDDYYFQVNNIDISDLSVPGTLYRLSRFEEGEYFANLNYAEGRDLGSALDLDTYVRGFEEECRYTNRSDCYEVGYYDTWLGLYRADLAAADNAANGALLGASESNGVITLTPTLTRLPAGANGLSAQAIFRPAAGGGSVIVDVDCSAEGCDPTTVTDLPAGDYQLRMRIFNDHPATEYDDFTTWGDSPFLNLQAVPITVTAGSDVRAISGSVVDLDRADGGDNVRIRFWMRNQVSRDNTIGRFVLRVRGAVSVDVRSVGVDDLVNANGAQRASGRGELADGTSVLWQLIVIDGDAPGVEGDFYRVRVITPDGGVVYDTQPDDPIGAAPSTALDSGSVRTTFI